MSSGGTNTTTTQSGPPQQFLDAYQNVNNQAQNVASTPYQPYTGNLDAPLSPDQNTGITGVQNAQGAANPYINAAAQEIGNSTSPLLSSIPTINNSELDDIANYGFSNLSNASTGGITNAAGTGASSVTNAANAGASGLLGETNLAGGNILGASGTAINNIGQNAGAGVGGILGAGSTGSANILNAGTAGVGGITSASTAFNPESIDQFESPYTQQVVGTTEAEFNNQNQQQQQQVAGNAASQGAYGGDREAVAQGITAGQQQLAEAPVIAGLENTGYEEATSAAETAAAQQLQGATAAGQLGVGAAEGAGQLGVTAATSAGQLGLSGAEAAGQLGVGAAENAGQLGITGYGEAGQLGLSGASTAGQLGLTGATSQAGAEEAAAQQELGLYSGQQGTELGANEANDWLSSQAGYGFSNLGNEALSSDLSGANAELGVGGLEQSEAQQSLNVPYEQQLAQQAYPFQTTGWLANIAEGLGGASGGTSSTTAPAPSVGSQVAGAGLAGVGILGQTGAFNSTGLLGSNGPLFGSSGGAGTTVPVTDAAGNAIGDGISIARGGVVPHRAPGGGVPDVDVSVVPGAAGMGAVPSHPGTFNLNDSTGSTTTTTGGGGQDSTFGSILKGAGDIAAGVYGGPAGALAASALGSQVHFGHGGGIINANDNSWEPMRHLATGGVAIPMLPGGGGGITPSAGHGISTGNVSIPQVGTAGGGITGGGTNPSVQAYLNAVQQTAQQAPHVAPAAPAAAAPAPAAAPPAPTPDYSNGFFNNGNFGGDGGRARGGMIHRADGGDMESEFPITTAQSDVPTLGAGAGEMPEIGSYVPAPAGQPQSTGIVPPNQASPGRGPPSPPQPTQSTGAGIIPSSATPQTGGTTGGHDPWNALLYAGLGILGGRSPNAASNIGQGALTGLHEAAQEDHAQQQIANQQQQIGLEGQRIASDTDLKKTQLAQSQGLALLQAAQKKELAGAQLGHEQDVLAETKSYHDQSLVPPDVREANWLANATPEEQDAYRKSQLQKKGLTDVFGNPNAGSVTQGANTPTGDDYLKTLNPQVQPMVKAMAEGRMAMPTRPSPQQQQIIQATAQYDPTFDATDYNKRNRTATDFSPAGQSGKAVTAINTTMGHLSELQDRMDALGNTDIPMVNTVKNWISTQTGKPEAMNAATVRDAVSNELRKVFATTGGGGLEELKQWENNFPTNASPAQAKSGIRAAITLMDSRLNSLGNQYSVGMGTNHAGIDLLSPDARTAYQKLTGTQPESANVRAPTYQQQPQGQRGSAPQWQHSATGPNGTKAFSNDGRTWFNQDGTPIGGQ